MTYHNKSEILSDMKVLRRTMAANGDRRYAVNMSNFIYAIEHYLEDIPDAK